MQKKCKRSLGAEQNEGKPLAGPGSLEDFELALGQRLRQLEHSGHVFSVVGKIVVLKAGRVQEKCKMSRGADTKAKTWICSSDKHPT